MQLQDTNSPDFNVIKALSFKYWKQPRHNDQLSNYFTSEFWRMACVDMEDFVGYYRPNTNNTRLISDLMCGTHVYIAGCGMQYDAVVPVSDLVKTKQFDGKDVFIKHDRVYAELFFDNGDGNVVVVPISKVAVTRLTQEYPTVTDFNHSTCTRRKLWERAVLALDAFEYPHYTPARKTDVGHLNNIVNWVLVHRKYD